MKKKGHLAITTLKQAKRVIITVIGFTLLLVGVAMLVLPGPGIVTIALALAILGTEFVWARRLYKRVERRAGDIKSSVLNNFKNKV